MKANELRIGNWIQASTYLQVDARFIYEYDKVGGDYKPIPLTEEWLVKLGFNYNKGQYMHSHKKDMYFYLTGDLPSELYVYANSGSTGIPIKHVHQLQNLYFALTGEELTIK